jgi:hypothetical protein
MSLLRPRTAVPLAAVLGAAALPAGAQAAPALLRPLAPCYVSVNPAARQVFTVRAGGFTPTEVVDVSVDQLEPDAFDADADGIVRAKVQASFQGSGERPMTVTLTERANPANTLTAFTRVTALDVTLRPRRAATSDRIRFRGRGFTRSSRAIWGHYVYRGRVRKTVRLAVHSEAPCGTFSVRRRQIPILHPRAGKWTLQVDQQRHYSPEPHSVFVPVPIRVERVIGR